MGAEDQLALGIIERYMRCRFSNLVIIGKNQEWKSVYGFRKKSEFFLLVAPFQLRHYSLGN